MEMVKNELNMNEMEQAAGGLRTEYLNAEELAMYQKLKAAADKAWYPSEITAAWDALFAFKNEMKNKYGDDIVSDEWEEILKKFGM